MLEDIIISKAILDSWHKDLIEYLNTDVAIVGGGPAGLVAGYYLAKEGFKVVLFEQKLSIGGGMWGGGMMYNKCVFQDESKAILDEFGIKIIPYQKGYYLTDSLETICSICASAIKHGLKIFNLISTEDVMVRNEKVTGLVINWNAVKIANLHVDPLTVQAKYIIEATGHSAEVLNIIVRKIGKKLFTLTGDLLGEQPMWAEVGEKTILENTKEVFPNVYVAGMSANAVFGGPRMGPIFGGMLLSGQKAAQLIKEKLREK